MKFPQIIFGTFQYADSEELSIITKCAYENGIVGFDTSPSYNTEKMLGTSLSQLMQYKGISRDNLFVQDKIDGWQMEETKGHIACHVESGLMRLGMEYLDVLFVHWPFPDYLYETWQSFAELRKNGKIRYLGLSNVRCHHVKRLIERTGIKPDVAQIERHPLRICKTDVNYFHSQNITVEAYSPVCRMDSRLLNSRLLKEISYKYNKSIGQVILRWHVDTNVIPVFMTKKEYRIKENTNIFDFSLSGQEIDAINRLNINYKIFVESVCCPGI